MTATGIWRLSCDGPHCPATAVVETISAVPDGWRRVSSTDHLADWKPGRRKSAVTGRMRTDSRTLWDVEAGGFRLHLCPDHATVFDAHLPRTEGWAAPPRNRERRVRVACECGVSRDATASRHAGRNAMPNGDAERAWWRHLPEDLREYATRGQAAEVTA